MKNKIFLSFLVFFVAVAVAGILKVNLVNAALFPATGWLWGGSEDSTAPPAGNMGVLDGNETGVGWVSMNSSNPNSAGGSYAVNIPTEDGAVVGFAWSSNLKSYIDFAPHMACPSNSYAGKCDAYPTNGGQQTDVMRVGNQLKGWARIVNIAVANAAGNSGGEDGWISLDPTPTNSGVTIDADGTIHGFGWAGTSLGAMSFESVQGPVLTAVTIQASPNIFNLLPGQNFVANANVTKLDWTIVGTNIQSCSTSCTDDSGSSVACPGWSGLNPRTSTTLSNVPVAAYIENFTITCTDNDGKITTASALVQTGCSLGNCSATAEVCMPFTGTFTPTTSGDAAACKGGCLSDNDCVFRQGDSWREIAP